MESKLDISIALGYDKCKANFPFAQEGNIGLEKSFRRDSQAKRAKAGGTGGRPGGIPADHWLIGERTIQSIHHTRL